MHIAQLYRAHMKVTKEHMWFIAHDYWKVSWHKGWKTSRSAGFYSVDAAAKDVNLSTSFSHHLGIV